MNLDKAKIKTILVTDCGSTTTKALLFEKTAAGWRQTYRGEAPTTVEEPLANVSIGALNAFQEIQDLSGRVILNNATAADSSKSPFVFTEADPSQGIDLYLSTSSAGGGLQMLVCGLVEEFSTESAERAALGAGAIVLETFSANDPRPEYERITRLRELRPDIILLAGGTEGGASDQILELAELIRSAEPKPRFGKTLVLPVVFAGNTKLENDIREILGPIAEIVFVDNLRPAIEKENLAPARDAIHDLFLSHVMSHSPGYDQLLSWTPLPIVPTPAAVGDMIESYANQKKLNILCADIGGATTDIFSVFYNKNSEAIFNRTVSANLGMSYSIAQVLLEAGVDNLKQWMPFELEDFEIRDRLRNKMIRPTTIPQIREDLELEQAVCREALRLSLEHHKSLAVGISSAKGSYGIANVFSQQSSREHLINMRTLDLVIGSGGVLSHAPRRIEAALMMLDGFELEGLTEVAVDSIFMLPHLGVLASFNPEAAAEIFEADCLVRICHSIAPRYKATKSVVEIAEVWIADKLIACVEADKLIQLDILNKSEEQVKLTIVPKSKSVDCGAGKGEVLEKEIFILPEGLILDGRNRPFNSNPRTDLIKRQVSLNE